MRLVHLSDLHLGFRQYERQTKAGINQREADIAATLERAIGKVIEIRPDVVLIAGDVFHTVRPSNAAIVHAFQQFSRLVQALPQAVVVMVAGNHDTPRTADVGSILKLFTALGINIVERTPKRFAFAELGLSILAVPDMESGGVPPLVVDPSAKYNLLVIHGEVEGVLPAHTGRASQAIAQRALTAEKWDYIALGHYHVYRSVLPNAFYSGSLDYTSSNPWGELVEETEAGICKGIIEHNIDTNTHTFHPLPPARRWVDLPTFSGAGLSPTELDARIKESVERCDGGIDDKIVRLVISDLPHHMLRELDHKMLRAFKRKALNFNLDTRRPEIIRPAVGQTNALRQRRPSLAEMLQETLLKRALAANIDRTALVELGLSYLREADSVTGTPETIET